MFTNTVHNDAPAQSTGDMTAHRWRAWWQWTMAVAVGELIGFGVPALVGAAAYALGVSDSVLNIAVIVGGLGEGIVLGVAQWLVLRRYVPQIGARAWVLATAAGALLAWIIGMGMATIDPTVWQTSPPVFIALAGVLAVVFLVAMGGPQWLLLRRHMPHAGWWIAANAVA
jgi:hypothetical protein